MKAIRIKAPTTVGLYEHVFVRRILLGGTSQLVGILPGSGKEVVIFTTDADHKRLQLVLDEINNAWRRGSVDIKTALLNAGILEPITSIDLLEETETADEPAEPDAIRFHSLGLRTGNGVCCLVCGDPDVKSILTGVVVSADDGDRVYDILQSRATLNIIEPVSEWRIDVQIGACKQHKSNLNQLDRLVKKSKGFISPTIVQKAIGSNPRSVRVDESNAISG